MTAVNQVQAHPAEVADGFVDATITPGGRRALNTRFSKGEGNDVALGHPHRPSWRGAIHSVGLVVAVPATMVLLFASSSGVRLRIGVAAYAVGVCSMLAASSIYHRWVHGLRARCAWRRADHAAIFAAIAGSSTPIILAALPGSTGVALVAAVWSAAIVGAGCKFSRWTGGDRAGTGMYAVTIALGAVALPWLWAREGVGPALFVAGGGAVYLVGAVCFARQWPTVRPAVFSYHEVWHSFTMVAAVSQFAAIWMLAI